MIVGLDVAPLVQTGAGTARVVKGLSRALENRPGLKVLPLSFGGPGRASTVARDVGWYPAGIAWAARRADVIHCTTMRGPVRSRRPVVVTVHDLALLRHPEAFPKWHRHTGRIVLRHGVHRADAVVAVSAFTCAELVEAASDPRGADPRRSERRRAAVLSGGPCGER